jgi:hypothetical protein
MGTSMDSDEIFFKENLGIQAIGLRRQFIRQVKILKTLWIHFNPNDEEENP